MHYLLSLRAQEKQVRLFINYILFELKTVFFIEVTRNQTNRDVFYRKRYFMHGLTYNTPLLIAYITDSLQLLYLQASD